MAMCEHGALASLLIEKGIITEDEYVDRMIYVLEKELQSYKDKAKELTGVDIEFH